MLSFIRNLFQGPIQILQDAIGFLNHLASVAASGINISDYLSWVGLLDPAWQGVIDSLLGCFGFIATLFIVRSIYRFYLSLKEGIQWW